jgi:hydroxymethylpyrimidine/phosphomethylpyrimidine kinase
VARATDCEFLAGLEVADLDGLRDAAKRLRDLGARAALVAGLVVRGRVLDLVDDDGKVVVLDTARIQAPRVPGLAGAHAAALTAHLARGLPLSGAAEAAQRYIGFRLQRGR